MNLRAVFPSWHSVTVALLIGGMGAGCRSHVRVEPVPLPSQWEHCWWTVIRSTLPYDTVASRFRRAFVTAGMPGLHWTKNADTVWVRAGPAPLLPIVLPFDTSTYGATYWSRLVAFSHRDSTFFRLYIAVVPPARGWPVNADSDRIATREHFSACETIANAAGVRWIRVAGDPGDEEKLPVWSRVP